MSDTGLRYVLAILFTVSYSFLATQLALEGARHSPLPYAMTYHFLAIPFTVLHESQAV